MVFAWLLFPLVLMTVCVGCGLAVERAAGWQPAGCLTPSVGLALVIVVASLTTSHAATAPLTTPLVVILPLAGYATSVPRLRALVLERWAVGVGVALFGVCAAPVVLSGNATFLGYFVLNDSAIHFALIDQLLSHGRDLSQVPVSSLSAMLHSYISTSYPTGADVALGAVSPLVAQDVAWTFQPYLAAVIALGGVAVYGVLDGAVRSCRLRALSGFIAMQAGLAYAYYLQASIKELATMWIVTVTVGLVFAQLRHPPGFRKLLPLIVAVVAGLDLLDLAIVPWLGPPVAVFVLSVVWRTRRRLGAVSPKRLALGLAGGLAVVGVLVGPLFGRASTFLTIAQSVLTQKHDLGNLAAPLQKWEMVGIWPNGDFRFAVTTHYRITYALIGVAIASAVLGSVWAVRRRAFAPLLLLGGNGIAAAYLLTRASPYASAKVMAVFSVTVMLTVMLGPAALLDAGRRLEGWMLAAVLAGGVLWTNALAYHDASIAPRARLGELAAIGQRFSGHGPSFYNLSDELAMYFLRREAPTDPGIGAPPVIGRVGLAPRTPDEARRPWDPDDLAPGFIQSFRLLVLGRSPRLSRPPSDFSLSYTGRYYEVWRRTDTPTVLEHIPLGSGILPAAVPSCRLVSEIAGIARRDRADLAYVRRAPDPALVPTQAAHPSDWGPATGDPTALFVAGNFGSVRGSLRVPVAGRYEVWLQASFSQRLQVWLGHQHVGSVAHELGPPGQFVRVGQVTLAAGEQQALINRPGNDLSPGDGGNYRLLGPLMLVPAGGSPTVERIDPRHAKALCGRSLDWLEVVR